MSITPQTVTVNVGSKDRPMNYRFSVAPMMDWTDRHCRMLHRQFTRHAQLWSEMITADAVIHGERQRLIGFSGAEHPVVLQLGGNEPDKMAEAARIAEAFGYDEVNINCGCPSDRVQSGAFGACLMADPQTVAVCVSAMGKAVSIPVTVKCRIAIDDYPPRETLFSFIEQVSDAGCEVFTVHARKAWLSGLSPKENREIPPLDYELVAALKQAKPDLTVILNGGITDLTACQDHLQRFDGVMLGRAAYQQPAILGGVDQLLFDPALPVIDAHQAITLYRPYMQAQLADGVKLSHMTRHMLGLFNGQPGARAYRRVLSEQAPRPGAGIEVLDAAVACLI